MELSLNENALKGLKQIMLKFLNMTEQRAAKKVATS